MWRRREPAKRLDWAGNGNSTWESVQAPVRLRPLVSARAYLIGPGDDFVVPETSATVPLCPPVWLQFGYSA